MILKEILHSLDQYELTGADNRKLYGLTHNSRKSSSSNNVFFAIQGTHADGHEFISHAISNKADIIFHEKKLDSYANHVSYVLVENTKQVLGLICNIFFEYPLENVKVIAVTGTNGKTSVANYTYQALLGLGYKPLLLSTAGDYFEKKTIALNREAPSTLETIEFFKVAQQYKEKGVTHICLEATSQALDQNRLAGISIDCAVFTNLEKDHLDYHLTMNHYAASKRKLFDLIKEGGTVVANKDDDYYEFMTGTLSESSVLSVSSQKEADVHYSIKKQAVEGMSLTINNATFSVNVFGSFNAINIALVYGVLYSLGQKTDKIIYTLSSLSSVPGRAEIIPNDKGVLALVDYAHSADAVKNFLHSLHTIQHRKIITVLGCGGDRDPGKRPYMAEAAVTEADVAIFTQDNPRTENPDQIFKDMVQNLDKESYLVIHDREEAIAAAVRMALPNDIITVLGKGHEYYQIIGKKKINFDDRKILKKYLES